MIKTLDKPLDFSNYKFRCSSWGNLMGEGKAGGGKKAYEKCLKNIEDTNTAIQNTPEEKKKFKGYTTLTTKLAELELERKELEKTKDAPPQLSQTAISYLIEIYCMVRDGIKKDIHSKYFEKGLAVEEAAIELLSDVDGEFYVKNTERLENEYISGECDIFHNNRKIIDNKSCWDRFTFQRKTIEKLSKIYEWQGIGYMGLWGAEEFEVANTLMNMPENLIADELKRMLYQYGSNMEESEVYQKAVEEYRKTCYFDELPITERVYKFPPIKYSAEQYGYGIEMVKVARQWLNEYAIKEYNRVNGIVPEPEREIVTAVMPDGTEFPVEVIATIIEPGSKLDILLKNEAEVHSKGFEEPITGKPQRVDVTIPFVTPPTQTEEFTDNNSIKIESFPLALPKEDGGIEIRRTEISFEEEQTQEPEDTLDVDLLIKAIQGCETVEQLKDLFEDADRTYELDEDIRQEFANKENELSKPKQQTTEEDDFLKDISNCKSKEEVIALYSKIKKHFATYPAVKTAITTKKDSFNEPEPKEEPKPEKPQRQAVKAPLIDEKTLVEGEYTEDELKAIRDEVDLCKTSDEIRTVIRKYFKSEAQLNIASHKNTRKYINDIGVAMGKKEAKK